MHFLSFTPKTPLFGEGFVVFVLRCGGWTDGGKVSIYVKHILCPLPAFRYAVLHRHFFTIDQDCESEGTEGYAF